MYLVQKFQGVNQKGVIRKLLHGIILFNWIKNYPKHFVICVEEFFLLDIADFFLDQTIFIKDFELYTKGHSLLDEKRFM